jgi:hypothetical protein
MTGLAALLVPSSLTAQITFQRTYGGAANDWGHSVQQTDDGGYVIVGATFGAGNGDAYLIKVDALGDTQWTRTYGGAGYEGANSVRQVSDGGYVLAGGTEASVWDARVYLVRADTSGETLWTRTFGPDSQEIQVAEQIQQTDDGGFVFVGYAYDEEVNLVAYVVRTDANGDSLWTREFGDPDSGYHFAYSVQQTTDGGYIVCGSTSLGPGAFNSHLVKLDSAGGPMWTATFGDTGTQESRWVEQTADGGYILTGSTNLHGDNDMFLIRTDGDGNLLWSGVYGGAGPEWGLSALQADEGTYAVLGTTMSFGAGGRDFYLVKTDAEGDTLWTRTFGGDSDDVACSFEQTEDGGYIIAGFTESFGAGGDDIWLVKTDSLGNVAVSVAEPKASPTPTAAMSLTCEPNPFSGATTIRLSPFAIGHSPLTLRIYDAQGRAVRSFSSLLSAPSSLTWDGTDDLGQPLPSGAYFVRVNGGNEHATTRIVLQR